MKQKLKQLLHTAHPQHEILALGMVLIGLILIFNDDYFFWPPFMISFLNDDLVGGVFVVDGILLLKWALSTSGKIYANRNLLIMTAGLLAFEATAEFSHGFIAHKPHMLIAGVAETVILLFTFSIIGKSKKHNY